MLYTSSQAHHSVLKTARLAGILPDRVRSLEVDGDLRLRPDALEAAIAADRATPSWSDLSRGVSAGTTNTGAVDPLDAVADIAAREGLWHHVEQGMRQLSSTCARSSAHCLPVCHARTRSR